MEVLKQYSRPLIVFSKDDSPFHKNPAQLSRLIAPFCIWSVHLIAMSQWRIKARRSETRREPSLGQREFEISLSQ